MQGKKKKYSGIIPPLATPLLDQNTLDTSGTSRLLRHVLDGGVHGLFILGTTGEAPSLSYRLRHQLLEQVISEVAGQVPVLLGVTDSSLEEAQQFAQAAQKSGADALVLASPFYYPAGQETLVSYVYQLLQAVEIPLFLYNIPSHSPPVFSQESIKRLLDHPQIAGYKDSTGSMIAFHQMKQIFEVHPEKAYLLGPEELLAESVLLGGDGGVNGGANLFPALYVKLYEAATTGEVAHLKALHKKVMQVSQHLYQGGKTVIQGIKYGLAFQGICQDRVALPLAALSEPEKERMRQFLENFENHF
ncbi:MAG: dihydrodipicolinate synthase family protein [Cyclobacteriaceae bacterium]